MKPASIILFLFITTGLVAQDFPCTYWPAPCPDESALNNSNNWTSRMKDSVAIREELAFDKKMKEQLTDLLKKTTDQKGWKIYQLSENTHDGPPFIFISYDAWENTPYEKRPPRPYDITFIVILNNDSLNAWKNWRINFQSKTEKGAQDYGTNIQEADKNPLLKIYFDSSFYFTQFRSNYIQAHTDQYQKDIKANNKRGEKEYEDALQKYQDKSDNYIKKYQDLQNNLYSNANNTMDELQNDEVKHIVAFAEGSIVLLHFMMNPYLVTSGLENGDQQSLIPQTSLKINGAFYAGLLINKSKSDRHSYELNTTGEIFNSPASVATIMFGTYQPKDSYNNYRPLFEKTFTNKSNTISTEKNIKCDVLQNLAVHIEGKPDKVKMVIAAINWDEVTKVTGK